MKKLFLRMALIFWGQPLWFRKMIAPIGVFILILLKNGKAKVVFNNIAASMQKYNLPDTKKTMNDILRSMILYGAKPEEYFLFKFAEKTDKERDEYLTDGYRIQLLKKYIGLNLFNEELLNKIKFYGINKEFFKRPCFLVDELSTKDEIKKELAGFSGGIFIKRNDSSFGSDGKRLLDPTEEELDKVIDAILTVGGNWIVEGLIKQDDSIGCWNKTSVNTIRIPSYLVNGKSKILMPFMRMGRAGAVVDNAGAGGVFAVIDEETGKIITNGADEQGNFYDRHPDAGITFKGWQVPRWNELLSIAEAAHKRMSHHKYIAYDFALSKDGWVMVEGNWGQYVCQQTSTQRGCKQLFLNYLKQQ